MADAKTLEELSRPEYWDTRYQAESKDATFEWFKSFAALESFFSEWLPRPNQAFPRILHLGCGNSHLPMDLYDRGYTNQVCVDFSEVVIRNMATRFAQHQGIVWKVEDVRHLSCSQDNDFDVAIDKGTLDAMLWGSLWDPPTEVKDNTTRYIDEIARVLKPSGVFLYLTYRQPHFMKPFLQREAVWDLQVQELKEEAGTFEYFAFVLKKRWPNQESSVPACV